MIPNRVLRTLEFDKIRSDLATHAKTENGRAMCLELVPETNISSITRSLDETEEAKIVLQYSGANPLIPFGDISGFISLAEKGGTLSPRALLNVAAVLRAAQVARDALVTDKENTPNITQLAAKLIPCVSLYKDIIKSILGDDEISDQASSELASIRRKIRQSSSKIKERLNGMIRSSSYQKYLQDQIITIRQDRYVLPIKAEYRSNVPGLVHDQSSSGATIFIEPMAVVEINNEIKQFIGEEKIEIDRILQAFSAEVGNYANSLRDNLRLLTRLDFDFAKGVLSKEMHGVLPKINQNGFINIIKGRHPLIDKDAVVPINIWLGDDFTTLVITGPNTGGKTVTLKTAGLFTLMMQAGLHVPAAFGTELAIFNAIYADIGDEQSIEQSLSTFSSHMKNIVEILNNIEKNDLVLFDELGAGTDPTEGAALAQCILTKLLKSKIRTMATTHYSELKAFALTNKGIENGSVEFNVETLSPTYRLTIGIPGKSNAFEISRKLGLPENIIKEAREILSKETIRFEDVIANAEYHRQIAEKEQKMAEDLRAETVKLHEEADKIRRESEKKRSESTQKAKAEGKRILLDARNQAEEIIRDLKRMKKQASSPQHEVQKLRKRMNDGIDALSEGLSERSDSNFAPPKDLNIGDEVLIVHLDTQATVLSKPDNKGEVQLQAGIMKLKAHITQLKKINEIKVVKKTRGTIKTDSSKRAGIPLETDVRGMTLDEAIDTVDSYLYEALMASYTEVYIIHGKGTGILRKGIQDHLRKQKHIKNYRLGRYGEGEDGVTVVTLK